MKWLLLTITLAGCCYTHESATSRTRLALFSNNERGAYGETEKVSPETVTVAGVGAAAWMDSWLAAWGIAVPGLVEVLRQPADNITTNTIEVR